MLKKIIVFCSILVLAACSRGGEEIEFIEDPTLDPKEKIKQALTDDFLQQLGIDKSAAELLRSYYKEVGFNRKWSTDTSLTPLGTELKKIVNYKFQFGIPEARYSRLKWKYSNALIDEILITTTLAYLANDLEIGFLENDTLLQKPLKTVSLQRLKEITNFSLNSLSLQRQIVAFGPADTNYQQLAVGLLDYCSHFPIDTTTYSIKPYKIDSLKSWTETQQCLVNKGYVDSLSRDSVTFAHALYRFQQQNGLEADGKIGAMTSKMLNESTRKKLIRTALAMEKWRWKNDYPSKHVRINLPEYLLRYVSGDSLISTHRMVIGKPDTQTPELSSKIRQIVVFPYWSVPYSIASKEILPHLKKDISYLAKNNYKIFKNQQEIDPAKVDWSKIRENSFPYKIRQEFGPKNSLGIIKFEFHNPYSVYVHDTPSKYLFNKDIRAFSHGCMRCEFPVELAKRIFERDSTTKRKTKITPQALDSLFAKEENYRINLIDPIPIFVEYKSVTTTLDGIVFHPDIYRSDEKYLDVMNF